MVDRIQQSVVAEAREMRSHLPMDNPPRADSPSPYQGSLTKQMGTRLRYIGKLPELEYQDQFTATHGLSPGRLMMLLRILEKFEPLKARTSTDSELETFFNGPLQEYPETHGIPNGNMAGLVGWLENGHNIFNDILVDDRQGGRPRLSDIGLNAFKDVAANYAFPSDPILPDIDALRADLNVLRTELEVLNRRISERGDGPAPIGHNNPPDSLARDLDPDDISAALDQLPAVIASAESDETAKRADPELLTATATRLNAIAKSVGRYLASGAGAVGKGAAQQMGKELWENPAALLHKLEVITHTLAAWARIIIRLFV